VPFFQPETAAHIFNRVTFNQDVATGKITSGSGYSTIGPSSAWSVSEVPTLAKAQCYLWDVLETCTTAEAAILLSGNAIVEDYVLVGVKNATSRTS
jgi:hypothetical protein